MKTIFTTLLIGLILAACDVKPEPLVMGKDACHTCKMTLVDDKFGAEIITKKGKVYKFDDLNCAINFYNSGIEPKENISTCMAAVYNNPKQLLTVTQAFYCQSDLVKSPMGGNVATFSNKDDLEKFAREWKGKTFTWNELLEQFK